MFSEVSECTDRDFCLRCVDGNAAAVCVVDRNDVVYVWIFWKKFFFHFLYCDIQYSCYALYGGADPEDVSGSCVAAVWICISFEGSYRRFRQVCDDVFAELHVIYGWRGWKFEHEFVDPVAAFDRVHGVSEDHAVADDRASFWNVSQCDFVCLRDVLVDVDAFHF